MKNVLARKLASMTLTGGLVFSLTAPAFAADDQTETISAAENDSQTTTTDAGTTPDSFLYFFDHLFESLELSVTWDDQDQAKLLTSLSEERMAELNDLLDKHENGEISDEEWQDLVDRVISNYKEHLNDAAELLTDLQAQNADDDTANTEDQNQDQDQSDELTDIIDALQATTDDVEEGALEENEDAVKDMDEAKAVVKVVSDYDQDKVQELRGEDLGYGEIAHIFALSEASGKSVDEIAAMVVDQKIGFGKLAKQLGVHPGVLGAGKHMKQDEDAVETDQEDNGDVSTDQGEVEETEADVEDTTATETDDDSVTAVTNEEDVQKVEDEDSESSVKKEKEHGKSDQEHGKKDKKKHEHNDHGNGNGHGKGHNK